jgi:cobalt-precorrin-5B (C1)-methyltransferase
MDAATTDACIEVLDEAGIRAEVLDSIMNAIQEKLEHRVKGKFRIGAIMFSNVYGQLGITGEGKDILRNWEDNK